MTTQQAREALKTQGFKAPGPELIERSTTIEQAGDAPAGERPCRFDYAEGLAARRS